MIGDYLGDPHELHLSVPRSFTHTFEFNGMIFDTVSRTFLESFWYQERRRRLNVSLKLSLRDFINNNNLRSLQVRKKVTEDEFISNNRAINAGNELPREYLSELFQSISTKALHSGPVEMNLNRWIELMNRTKTTQPYRMYQFDRRIRRDVFATIACPSITAISAFFEHSDDDEVLHECVDAMISIASYKNDGVNNASFYFLRMK